MPRPPFQISSRVLSALLEIERLRGQLEGLETQAPEPKLRRKNRVRTVQGSLAIEGNTLSLEHVTAVLEGKRVRGPAREILEVQNANRAYEAAPLLLPWSQKTLLAGHRLLMTGLIPDAGRWRTRSVGVFRGQRLRHLAPGAARVPSLMRQLVSSLRADTKTPVLVKACVAHYELQFIHPFSDGNGRMGRLWQHIILVHESPIFALVPVESLVRERQKAYYAALAASDDAGDSTAFIEFMLRCIRDGLAGLAKEFRMASPTPEDRLEAAKNEFGARWFGRKEYLALFKRLSTATASRDLRLAVELRIVSTKGAQSTTRYRFAR